MSEFVGWFLPSAEPFKANVLSGPLTAALGPVEDKVSQKMGNRDGTSYCGARIFKLLSGPSFASVSKDNQSLELKPILDEELGIHEAEIEVTLETQPHIT